MNRLLKFLGVMLVGAIIGPPILQYIIKFINSIPNPMHKLFAWSILLVCSVIVFIICIDLIFKTKITEKVVAGLITNILWEFIKFVGKIFVKWYAVTTIGILSLIKIVQKKL